MRWGPWVVVAVVLLAGCSGFGAAPGQRGTPTVTPAPLPTSTATPTAPWITDAGVVDAEALGTAHTAALRTTSYVLSANRTVSYANGTLHSRLSLRVALASNRTYLARASTAGPEAPVFLGRPPAQATFWSNGSLYLRALTRGDHTVYNTFEPPDQYSGTWRYWTRTVPFGGRGALPMTFYASVFRTVPTRVAGRTADGDGYRLVDAGPVRSSNPDFSQQVDGVRNVSLVALVDSRGIVRSLELEYSGEIDGRPVRVTRTVRYTQIGRTIVGRPPWFEFALAG